MKTKTPLRIPAPENCLADSGTPGWIRQDDRTLCHIDRLVETLARELSPGVRTLTSMVLLFTIDCWLAGYDRHAVHARQRAAAVWRLYEAVAEELHQTYPGMTAGLSAMAVSP